MTQWAGGVLHDGEHPSIHIPMQPLTETSTEGCPQTGTLLQHWTAFTEGSGEGAMGWEAPADSCQLHSLLCDPVWLHQLQQGFAGPWGQRGHSTALSTHPITATPASASQTETLSSVTEGQKNLAAPAWDTGPDAS